MGEAGGRQATTLEYTPTWVVAIVCCVIVIISLAVERLLHYACKYFRKNDQKPLAEALEKIKEELMLLGFISLLLTVSQDRISRICISKDLADSWMPCSKDSHESHSNESKHLQTFFFPTATGSRRLLSEATDYCSPKGKVPLSSITALHHLHIFIFVLAVAHVTFCALTIVFGGAKVRQWKPWEDAIQEELNDPEKVNKSDKVTHIPSHAFIKKRYLGIGKRFSLLSWLQSFFKQFFWSVTKLDYETLRRGFIEAHSKGNPKYNFYNYMTRAFEADFKKVVGIKWYLWVFVVLSLLLNVHGFHAYFYISFIPFILLLAVGTKLEHIITDLALDVAEKHVAVEGELVVRLSDEHFWFGRPKIILTLIHIILFQNSVELSFFFFILVVYKFDSCMMGQVRYIIPRLVIGVFVQFLCSYSTLPLYALVTQMGNSFKKEIFDDHIQESLVGWANKARMRKVNAANAASQVGHKEESPVKLELATLYNRESGRNAGEITWPEVRK